MLRPNFGHQILDRTRQMTGEELVAWRLRNGYTQEALMKELGVKSRQTISSWEKPGRRVERTVELALNALERDPTLRMIAGKKASAREAREARAHFAGDDKWTE